MGQSDDKLRSAFETIVLRTAKVIAEEQGQALHPHAIEALYDLVVEVLEVACAEEDVPARYSLVVPRKPRNTKC